MLETGDATTLGINQRLRDEVECLRTGLESVKGSVMALAEESGSNSIRGLADAIDEVIDDADAIVREGGS